MQGQLLQILLITIIIIVMAIIIYATIHYIYDYHICTRIPLCIYIILFMRVHS